MYKKILVPLDGSPLAECVFPHIESVAKSCGVAQVVFVRVAESVNVPFVTGDGLSTGDWNRIEAEHHKAAEAYLKNVAEQSRWSGLSVQAEVLSEGDPADRIVDYATRNGIDLIVIATHGRSGVSRWVLGSVAERVLRSSPVPVLMVSAPGCKRSA